jgi:conjugal transfer/entry exclusion protein
MSFVEVRDHALWVNDIHGNKSLQERIRAMKEGELIELKVNGVRGMWERMKDSGDAHATPGIKALGEARSKWHRSKWHELRSERQGGITTVEACD